MKNFFLQQVRILQVCKACLERMPANDNTIQLLPEGICHSLCEECLENSKVCASCAEQSSQATYPAFEHVNDALILESNACDVQYWC